MFRSIALTALSPRRPSGSSRELRHGISLVLVLLAVSMSLMLTYAALSSQSRGMQVRQNVNRQELARQAAESGATIALAKMQAADWAGVSSKLTGTLDSDSVGFTGYSVEFLLIDGQTSPTSYPSGQGKNSISAYTTIFNTSADGLTSASADAAAVATKQAFQLLIRSTGKWQSASVANDVTTEIVEVGVELQPRVSGRTLLAGDWASASDVLKSTGDYDSIQNYALFAKAGSSSNPSLQIEPGQRIDGPCWLYQGAKVFTGPNWSSSPRNQFLQDVGTLHTSTSDGQTTLLFPHPFGGPITHFNSFSSSQSSDLTRLNVPRQQVTSVPVAPTVSFTSWRQYQLFQGGFTYDAVTLTSSSLDDDILRPSLRNPLGVFYREGDLTIDDDVVIQGTLICTGKVRFTGNNVLIGSVNWRDAAGTTLLTNSHLFPRTPAIVARDVQFDRSMRVTIEGAVIVTNSLTGSDGDYEWIFAPEISLAGSQATVRPLRQPYSEVQLPSGADLTNVSGGGLHAIWLADGTSGNWFPIAEVDTANRRLTVLGEARRAGPVDFRIRRQRHRHADVRGPLFTMRLDLNVASAWKIGSSMWNSRFSLWQWIVDQQEAAGQSPTTPWESFVADPNNYPGWGSPYDEVGLPLEPTFHLRPLPNTKYRDSLPLFQGYVPPSGDLTAAQHAGLRWRILFWKSL